MRESLCKYFRAKSPGHGMVTGGSSPNLLQDDNLAQCWCIKTQGPMAPDNGFVAPSACVDGRTCFTIANKFTQHGK